MAAFLIPWVLSSLVHYIDTALAMVCFFAVTIGIFVAYVNPFIFFCETVKEASHFETNFRLSLKQMYDGDRLSKKETSILPKTACNIFEIGHDQNSRSDQSNAIISTDATSQHKA